MIVKYYDFSYYILYKKMMKNYYIFVRDMHAFFSIFS